MLFKDEVVYLQAGGGIVYDSVEETEYYETMNKLGSSLQAITDCEQKVYEEQMEENGGIMVGGWCGLRERGIGTTKIGFGGLGDSTQENGYECEM